MTTTLQLIYQRKDLKESVVYPNLQDTKLQRCDDVMSRDWLTQKRTNVIYLDQCPDDASNMLVNKSCLFYQLCPIIKYIKYKKFI